MDHLDQCTYLLFLVCKAESEELLQPIRYGFESLIVNEFHSIHGQCSSLIPFGPGYEGISIDNHALSNIPVNAVPVAS